MKLVKVLQLKRKFGNNLSNNEQLINIKHRQDTLNNNKINHNNKCKSKKNNPIKSKVKFDYIIPLISKLIPQLSKNNPRNEEEYLDEIIKNINYTQYENILNYSKDNIFSIQDMKYINEQTRKNIIETIIYHSYIWNLNPDSAFLAVNIMDRYSNKTKIKNKNDYELIGLGSFLIASKYEDIYSPDAETLTKIFEYKYHYKDILEKEEKILISLDYRLMYISSYKILNLLFHLSCINDTNLINFANMVLEFSLTEINMMKYTQIKRAIGCFIFAKRIFCNKSGNNFIKLLFSYDDNEIDKIVQKLFVILKDVVLLGHEQNLIAEKYRAVKFNAIFSAFEKKLNEKIRMRNKLKEV